MNTFFVVLTGLVAGSFLGVLSGFGMSAHQSTVAGIFAQPKNRLIAFLCRPTNQMSSSQTLALFFLVIATLPVTFALLVAPAIIAGVLNVNDESTLVAGLGVEIIAIFLARYVGSRLWLRSS